LQVGAQDVDVRGRADIAVGIESGLSDTEIADKIGRDRTVVWRERRRNSTKTRGYRPVHADCEAEKRRRRPQQFKIDTDPVLTARAVSSRLEQSMGPRTAGTLNSAYSGSSIPQ
jgi:IS30 family transposase